MCEIKVFLSYQDLFTEKHVNSVIIAWCSVQFCNCTVIVTKYVCKRTV